MTDAHRRPVFVTGATGYVGRHVLVMLARAGTPVRALSRRPHVDATGHVSWVSGDLSNVSQFARMVDGCAAVVHCAKAGHEDAPAGVSADVDGTLALWHAARNGGVSRFIHLSTISVYELPPHGVVDETCPYTNRDDAYARSKIVIEQALLAQTGGPALGILQPGCVYGATGGWWTGTVLDLMRRGTVLVPDHGRGIANLIHVADLADAVGAALAADQLSGRFIITDGRPITWAEFYDVLESIVGRRATLRLSLDACLARAAQLRRRDPLARLRRTVERLLTGGRPVFPADDLALLQAASRAECRPARAAELLGFRAARAFGAAQIG